LRLVTTAFVVVEFPTIRLVIEEVTALRSVEKKLVEVALLLVRLVTVEEAKTGVSVKV
jgi:hypothetical protein